MDWGVDEENGRGVMKYSRECNLKAKGLSIEEWRAGPRFKGCAEDSDRESNLWESFNEEWCVTGTCIGGGSRCPCVRRSPCPSPLFAASSGRLRLACVGTAGQRGRLVFS